MDTPIDTLFVYGTLMRDEPRHHLIADRVIAACPARCEGALAHMGPYPALIAHDPVLPADVTSWAQGELLLIDDLEGLLPTLDRVEGCAAPGEPDGLYRRVRREVEIGGVRREAWVYLLEDHVKRGPVIPSGSWKVRHTVGPEAPTPAYGLHEILMMMEGWEGGPGSEALLPDEHEPVVTWGGADLVLADRPLLPPPPDYDPWGKFHRNTFVVSPHALALAWLVSELMDRVLWRGLQTDKYSFFEQLGKAANKVLEVRPRASERALMGAMWCAAADIASFCGWERGEE
jgi:gamma-glutamylcyclotransferase (GGCT)/AIG2-like uncharacterized protein YtfP